MRTPRFRTFRAFPIALVAVMFAGTGTSKTVPTLGRETGSTLLPRDTIEVASNPLEAASLSFARALAAGSRADLSELMVEGDIRLQLEGPSRAGISARQAAAALADFLRGFDEPQALLSRASSMDGSPDRGFAEILWSGRAVGTSGEVHRTLFLSLMRAENRWGVDEIRLVR